MLGGRWGSYQSYVRDEAQLHIRKPRRTDAQAIAQDWRTVGDEMYRAMGMKRPIRPSLRRSKRGRNNRRI